MAPMLALLGVAAIVQFIPQEAGSVHIRSLIVVIFAGLLIVACGQRVSTQEQEQITLDVISDFRGTASNVFLYYSDVEAATKFYRDIFGLRVAADAFHVIEAVSPGALRQRRDKRRDSRRLEFRIQGSHALPQPEQSCT